MYAMTFPGNIKPPSLEREKELGAPTVVNDSHWRIDERKNPTQRSLFYPDCFLWLTVPGLQRKARQFLLDEEDGLETVEEVSFLVNNLPREKDDVCNRYR